MKKIYLILFFVIFIPNIIFAKINDVAFISQVLPGNWNYTLNCGQTSYYMVLSYINGIEDQEKLDFNEIKKIDDWLYKKYGDPIRDYNGYYTTVDKINAIASLRDNIKETKVLYGNNDFESLKKEIDIGNVAIVAVRINMNSSKEGHFMVLIGYDDKYVYLNDPGKMLGKKRRYLIDDFLTVWKTQNYSYVIIKKENEKKEEIVKQIVKNKEVKETKKEDPKIIEKKNEILLNEVIEEDNTFLQTVIMDSKDQLKIITVEAELENKNEYPFLDENNWMHLGEKLVIDYNIPKVINSEVEEIESGEVEEVESGELRIEGYGYGQENQFEFINNYEDGRLIIPLNWTNKNNNFVFDLDYKIGNGNWTTILERTSLLNYNFYVKENNVKYYFRLRGSNGENYSNYKIMEQYVNVEPLSDLSVIETIESDTILGENRTYFCNECVLNKNINLLVEGGVKIKMNKGSRFMFLGNAFFMGNDENKIYIVPNNNDNKSGDIGFIYFYENKFVELNSVDVGYGGYIEFPGKVGDMIQIDKVENLVINNSYFHDTYLASGANINIVNSNVNIHNSKFSNALYGFKIANSSGEIINNEFFNNHYNFGLYNVNKTLKVYNNKISNGINLAIFGQNILADLRDNIFENNKFNLISMTSLNIESGEFTLSKGIYNIYEANISENATLNIEDGTIFKSYTDHGRFKINGKIIINSSLNNPVVFTSFFDDSYGGDSNLDGNNFIPNVGDWGYLEFGEKSYGSIIQNVIFKYGGNHNFLGVNHGVIYINGGNNINIKDSIFDKGFYRNIEINSGHNINIENNKIFNANIYGIDIKNGENIIIKNNEFFGNKTAGICYKNNESIILDGNIFRNNMNDIVVLP